MPKLQISFSGLVTDRDHANPDVRGEGTTSLADLPSAKAATGKVISVGKLGAAETLGRRSGVVDHVPENDEHALIIVRDIVSTLQPRRSDGVNSRISVMGGERAASVLATVYREPETRSEADAEAFKSPVRQRYQDEGNPWYAAAHLQNDGISGHALTKGVPSIALATASNAPIPERTSFGGFRM